VKINPNRKQLVVYRVTTLLFPGKQPIACLKRETTLSCFIIFQYLKILKFWNFMNWIFWKFWNIEIFYKFWYLMKILNFFKIFEVLKKKKNWNIVNFFFKFWTLIFFYYYTSLTSHWLKLNHMTWNNLIVLWKLTQTGNN
jgi:hypothetical protein